MLISFSIVDFLPSSYITNVLEIFLLPGCHCLISFMGFQISKMTNLRILCALPSMKLLQLEWSFFFSKMKQRNLIKCIFNILEKIKLSQYLQKYDFPFKGIHLHEWQYLVIAAVFYNNTMNNVWTLFELGLKNWDGCTNCSLEFWPSSNHMFGKYNSYFNDQGVNILHSHGQIPSVNRYSIFMLENFFLPNQIREPVNCWFKLLFTC